MKHPLVLAMLLFTGLAASNAQTNPRVELELGGVTVWLGMPKALAEKQLTEAGYRLEAGAGTDFVIWQGGTEKQKRRYSVGFRGGKLSYADRDWFVTGQDPFEAVLAALGALSENATSPCFIMHDPLSEPEQEMDRIVIQCGQRSVLLMLGTFRASGSKYVEVTERIGALQ